jgi:nitrate reductase NapE component
MTLNLYRWVCRGEDQEMLQKKIKWYIFATLTFALTIATIALVGTFTFYVYTLRSVPDHIFNIYTTTLYMYSRCLW